MATTSPIYQAVVALARAKGVLRVQDLKRRGIHPEYLRRLWMTGVLRRTGRGLYVLADQDLPGRLDLMEAARRVPNGVVCLVSALRFHEIGTQAPHHVWMMIDRRAHHPRVDYPPMRFFRASGAALLEGREHHQIDGVDVSVYSVAKTIADCFRYRNKIGMDIALEALREALGDKRCPVADLWKFARICRVAAVMKPYLEALA